LVSLVYIYTQLIKKCKIRLSMEKDCNFYNEESCIDYLEKIRWNGIVESPFSSNSKIYTCARGKYKCRDTGKYFTVKTDTLFHNSKIPLVKWFEAISLITESKDMTSVKLAYTININQKTAWYMLKRIKRSLDSNEITSIDLLNKSFIEQLDVVVEKEKLNLVDWLNLTK
jgi:transposase-like protein